MTSPRPKPPKTNCPAPRHNGAATVPHTTRPHNRGARREEQDDGCDTPTIDGGPVVLLSYVPPLRRGGACCADLTAAAVPQLPDNRSAALATNTEARGGRDLSRGADDQDRRSGGQTGRARCPSCGRTTGGP